MLMDGAEGDDEIVNEAMKTDRTRGQMLQRHKLEWKQVRKDMDNLKRERIKLSKKNTDEKGARKDMSRQLKSMLLNMQQRHRDEIAAWDTTAAADAAEEMSKEA